MTMTQQDYFRLQFVIYRT